MSYETIGKLLEIFSKPADDSSGFQYKTLLDIGCGNGYFVKEMRKDGILAVGIDLAPRTDYRHIKKGDARNLAECFGNKKFDVITANGVLNSGGLLEMLMLTNPEAARCLIDKKVWNKKDKDMLHDNAVAILRSCYEQLGTPGIFINSEGNYWIDYLVYSKKDAKCLGFSPFIFQKDISVLIKE